MKIRSKARKNIENPKYVMAIWFTDVNTRGKRITLGKTSVLTPAQARDRAKEIFA